MAALTLSRKQSKATTEELKNVNRILKNVPGTNNKIIFKKIGGIYDLCMIGVCEASYRQERHSVAGEII